MLAIYRHFPFFLFLVWLIATTAVFLGSVWGRLSGDMGRAWTASLPSPLTLEHSLAQKVRDVWDFSQRSAVTESPTNSEGKVAEDAPSTSVTPLDVQEISTPLRTASLSGQGGGQLVALKVDGQGRRADILLRASSHIQHINWFNMSTARDALTAVDLMGDWTTELPERAHPTSGPIRRLIIGQHPDRLRISFFFKKGVDARHVPTFTRVQEGVKITFDMSP